MDRNSDLRYKVALVAHKDLPENVKNLAHRHSICNIKTMDYFKDMVKNKTNYCSSGLCFNVNDRIDMYIDWFEEDIEKMLVDGYAVDILELHRSYGSKDLENLQGMKDQYGPNIEILNTKAI